jgi:hypothetical protein
MIGIGLILVQYALAYHLSRQIEHFVVWVVPVVDHYRPDLVHTEVTVCVSSCAANAASPFAKPHSAHSSLVAGA